MIFLRVSNAYKLHPSLGFRMRGVVLLETKDSEKVVNKSSLVAYLHGFVSNGYATNTVRLVPQLHQRITKKIRVMICAIHH